VKSSDWQRISINNLEYRILAPTPYPRRRSFPNGRRANSSRQRFTEISPQACIFETNQIILNKKLKGQLELSEWKPLLAASIIYNQTLKPRTVLGIILRLSLPVALYALAWILLWLGGIIDKYLPGAAFYRGQPIFGGTAGFTFIVGFVILTLLLGIFVASPYVKKRDYLQIEWPKS
jgi:hypothetical protein